MTIRKMCAYMVMASGILYNAGCSLMIDQPKGDTPSESILASESNSLTGVYTDIDANGSIEPHPQIVGEGGRINGLATVGGLPDVLDIKTGTPKPRRSTNTTSTVRMGESTFSFGSDSNSTGSSSRMPGAGNK